MRAKEIIFLIGILSILTTSSFAFETDQKTDTTIYTITDTVVSKPVFAYKDKLTYKESIYEFFKDNLKQPTMQDCFATVVVEFIIEKDASLTNLRILRDIPGCSEYITEALRLVRVMNGLWKPAIKDECNVRYKMVVAVNFNKAYD